MIKSNTYSYKKDLKGKAMESKTNLKTDKIIHNRKSESHTAEEIVKIINMAKLLVIDSNTDDDNITGEKLDRE